MVKAIRGSLVQADESVMAIIRQIDAKNGNTFIQQDLDAETCLVSQDKIKQLENMVREKIQQTLPEVEEESEGE